MKKLLFILLFTTTFAFSQEKNLLADKNNEVRVDVLSAIAFGKAAISYERFLGNFSVGITGSAAYGKKLDDDFDSGFTNTLPKYEAVPFVRYRLSKSPSHYYFIEAFASANGGDFKQILRIDDGSTGYYTISRDTYFDLALGGSLGYKVYFAGRIALEFTVGAGYNLIDREKSPDVISRVGIHLGYRF
jgi:hypothetical protein